MPITGLHHIDLAVSDIERSLAFYLGLLGPLGTKEYERYPSYRGTEEVVYLSLGEQMLGLRPADGGVHRYYDVGVEHFAIRVDSREDVERAHERFVEAGVRIHHPPEYDNDVPGYYALFAFDPDGIRVEIFHWDESG